MLPVQPRGLWACCPGLPAPAGLRSTLTATAGLLNPPCACWPAEHHTVEFVRLLSPGCQAPLQPCRLLAFGAPCTPPEPLRPLGSACRCQRLTHAARGACRPAVSDLVATIGARPLSWPDPPWKQRILFWKVSAIFPVGLFPHPCLLFISFDSIVMPPRRQLAGCHVACQNLAILNL